MIMIPPYCSSNIGEKKVFEKLKTNNNSKTKDWVVYHSLNYPVKIQKNEKKSFQYFGEADFVILIPNKGLINIEVKGGSISCADGIWSRSTKSGLENFDKSPIKQASDSKYNIRKYIETKIGKKIPQEFLLVFTDCSFDLDDDNIEYSKSNIIDSDGFLYSFIDKLISLSNKLISTGSIFQISEIDFDSLKKIIRPNFENLIKKSTILKESSNEIYDFTEEQLKVLNFLDDKPRLLISGSQGTGKSAMAEEILKRQADTTSKIIFINSNRLANAEMKFKFKEYKNIEFRTFYSLIKEMAYPHELSTKIKKNFLESNNYLINKSIDFFEEYKKNKEVSTNQFCYDMIVFDEMQNCFFFDNFYKLLELILKNGLMNGNYYFMGDFKYQNLVSEGNHIDPKIIAERSPENNLLDYTPQLLFNNVRNARSISTQAPILSGLFTKFPYELGKAEHGEVNHFFLIDKEAKIRKLKEIIIKLHQEKISGNDIVILSDYSIKNNKNFLNEIDVSDYYQIINLTEIKKTDILLEMKQQKNSIFFSTTSAFQGLESKIVIYLDPLEHEENFSLSDKDNMKAEMLAFNAMGRANTFLYILWDKRYESIYQKKLQLLGALIGERNS
jgi:hypothetical protein